MANYGGGSYRPSFFGGFSFFPPVIKTLLIVNLGVFLFDVLFFQTVRLGGIPLEIWFYQYFALNPLGYGFKVWQLVTYQFMHAGFMHIFFNMFALWMFGMELENVWGSKKFLIYYLTCGVGAGLANLFLSPLFAPLAPTVGASGAIYGVLVAFAMLFPDRPIYLYFFVPVKAKYFVLFYVLLELFSLSGASNVAHFAHLGGAFVGFVYLMIDRQGVVGRWFRNLIARRQEPTYRSGSHPRRAEPYVSEAKYYDIQSGKESKPPGDEITQETIDAILDKISRSGYQSLTEEEKRILFEASKKLN
jgi:membrane associated rhomboid family serine protease